MTTDTIFHMDAADVDRLANSGHADETPVGPAVFQLMQCARCGNEFDRRSSTLCNECGGQAQEVAQPDEMLTLNEAKARKAAAWERKELLLQNVQSQAEFKRFRKAEDEFLMWNSIVEAMERATKLMMSLRIKKPEHAGRTGESVTTACNQQCDRLRQLVAAGEKQTVSEQSRE